MILGYPRYPKADRQAAVIKWFFVFAARMDLPLNSPDLRYKHLESEGAALFGPRER